MVSFIFFFLCENLITLLFTVSKNRVALVVAHGGSIRMFLAQALSVAGSTAEPFKLTNTGVSVLTLRGLTAESAAARIIVVNDAAHLERRSA